MAQRKHTHSRARARDQMIERVVLDYLRQRATGGRLTCKDVLGAHPELLPELSEALRKARLIEEARLQAHAPSEKLARRKPQKGAKRTNKSHTDSRRLEKISCNACLFAVNGAHRGARFEFSKQGRFIFGRSRRAGFVLAGDMLVSRFHFAIEYAPPHYQLRDLDSEHGTFLNRAKVQQAELQEGDLIQAGCTAFRFCMLSDPAKSRSKTRVAKKCSH